MNMREEFEAWFKGRPDLFNTSMPNWVTSVLEKNGNGQYVSTTTRILYDAFLGGKNAESALAAQAQQAEYTFDQLTKLLMQAATKEGHKVTMKIKRAQSPAPEGGE